MIKSSPASPFFLLVFVMVLIINPKIFKTLLLCKNNVLDSSSLQYLDIESGHNMPYM